VGKRLNKAEAEALLNRLFGVEVKWSKLTENELTQLLTVLANPDALIRRLGGVPKAEFKEEARKDLIRTFLESWEGPFVSVLRDFLGYGKKEEAKGEEKVDKAV